MGVFIFIRRKWEERQRGEGGGEEISEVDMENNEAGSLPFSLSFLFPMHQINGAPRVSCPIWTDRTRQTERQTGLSSMERGRDGAMGWSKVQRCAVILTMLKSDIHVVVKGGNLNIYI